MSAPEDHLKVVEELKEAVGAENVLEWSIPRERRIFVRVRTEKLRDSVRHLRDVGFKHVSTISGVDTGDGIDVVYHLARGGVSLALKVRTDYEGKLPTITDIIPGAVLYEREVHDLFGVVFENHPDLSRLILPDDWPEGVYPLLKKWKIEDLRRRLMESG